MEQELWLIGGGPRSRWAAEYFRKQGINFHSYGVTGLEDQPLPRQLEDVILPFPSFQGALLRGHSAVPVEELLCRLHSGSRVFGGLLKEQEGALSRTGARLYELYGAEPFTTLNAIATAEGALALTMEHSPRTLHGGTALIIGYGRIGKILGQKLRALHCAVTVCARKAADLALAEAEGFLTDRTGQYEKGLAAYDFIFNTVPATVLSPEQLAQTAPHCLLMELASPPGGIPKAACEALARRYLPAPGLPERCAPQSAGMLYARCIQDLILREASQ